MVSLLLTINLKEAVLPATVRKMAPQFAAVVSVRKIKTPRCVTNCKNYQPLTFNSSTKTLHILMQPEVLILLYNRPTNETVAFRLTQFIELCCGGIRNFIFLKTNGYVNEKIPFSDLCFPATSHLHSSFSFPGCRQSGFW